MCTNTFALRQTQRVDSGYHIHSRSMNRFGAHTMHSSFVAYLLSSVLLFWFQKTTPSSYSLCDTLPVAATTFGIMTSIPPTLVAMRVKCPSQFGDPSLDVWRRCQGTL